MHNLAAHEKLHERLNVRFRAIRERARVKTNLNSRGVRDDGRTMEDRGIDAPPVIETASGWRIGNSIFRGSEFHGYSLLFGGREYCSRGCASREDRENGNGPRLRRKPPPPTPPRLDIPRRCTFPSAPFDSRINPCLIPNIYKEFYWNASRVSRLICDKPCYPPTLPPFSSSLYFHADARPLFCYFRSPSAKSSFHLGERFICARNDHHVP